MIIPSISGLEVEVNDLGEVELKVVEDGIQLKLTKEIINTTIESSMS